MLWLLNLVNPLAAVAKEIAHWQFAKEQAKTDKERIYAEERLGMAQARRDALMKAADLQAGEAKVSPINIIMRAVLTVPVAMVLFKVLAWDIALGQWTGGRTDKIAIEVWAVIASVIGFYFVTDMVEMINRIKARKG